MRDLRTVVSSGEDPQPDQFLLTGCCRHAITLKIDPIGYTFNTVAMMLDMLQDLARHRAHASASLLRAIRQHEISVQDMELRQLLHHIILANRFWLMLSLGIPFSVEQESRIPESLEALAIQYEQTHEQELQWISDAQESDLSRTLETPWIPGQSFSLAQAFMQVCMHSHGHRAQCATRLRLLSGTPPNMDFILWLKERPAADWSS